MVVIVLSAFLLPVHQSSPPAVAIDYPPGWNIVAGPDGSRLRGAFGPIYTLRPGDTAYEVLANTTPLRGGWGYWAYFPDGGEIDLGIGADTQVSLTTNQLTLVGNPYDDGDASINGVLLLYAYAPESGYAHVSSLPVGSGGWGIGRTSFSINLAAPVPASALPALSPPPTDVVATPISVSATLDSTTCDGGELTIAATVIDSNGAAVAGASVTLHVDYATTSRDLTFPPTDSAGSTALVVDTGSPRSGSTVTFTVTATVPGSTASTVVPCSVP
jgi:hypothetical protein